MVAINTKVFGGMIPAVDDHLLPPEAAAHAANAWLYSGKIIGLPASKLVRTGVLASLGRTYRIPNDYSDAAYMFNSHWMEFTNPEVDVLRSSVHDDTFERHYWVSTTLSPRYNTLARILAGNPEYLLGIPVPGAISVAATGGVSAITVSRAYVVTWVSAYGEEGAPCTPFLLTAKQDDTWTVTLPTPAAGDLGTNRNLTRAFIYRTVTSSTGIATYFFVADVPIATATYADTLTDTVVTSKEQLESQTWTPPPSDLEGWIMMPNGIIAAWRNNELWFSEPYRPHAWPAAYVLTTEYPIVGLGIINQTLVVGTQGYPLTAHGTNPAYMTTTKLTAHEPCISRSSIVSAPEGVYYSSPNGLILVVPGRAENVTRDVITKDVWASITEGTKLRAARLGTGYFAYGSVAPRVFQENAFQTDAFAQENFVGAYNGVLIDPQNKQVAMVRLESATAIQNVFNDPWSGDVFIIKNDDVYWLDMGDQTPTYEPATWRSKIFQTADKGNIGAMRVYFSIPATTPAQNPTRNTAAEQTLAADQYGLVRVWADGRLIMTRELRTSGELWKLPSGFKADYFQFEIEARVRIISAQVASTAKELVSV